VECGFKSRRRTEGKKLEPSKEGTKEDHLQTQREEVEEQLDIPEEQRMEKAEGRRTSPRLKDKPRVDYKERSVARPREDKEVAFVTIAKESKEPKEVFALAASKDPDTMYYHEAMREPDREEFKGAMKKEVEAHTKNEVWELVKKSVVPTGHKIMPSVWSMKRKRRIATREIYKWKARLNID
jgi:crotonobetainyl-CoA:carnitine CoA-transferase CaiB-like acyl-CoA transferase